MPSHQPTVSVLMPVHNGEKYLEQSISSILKQTFENFEFLIINDGSTDASADIISAFHDPRISVVHHPKNLGLIESLNRGLKIAQGRYIARMDCDDISLSNRLKHQIQFMETHPEITVCGSWVKTIGQSSGKIWHYPTQPNDVKCQLLFESPLAHPTVIIRRKDIPNEQLYYDHAYQHAEDYEFWIRLADSNSLANIGAVLLLYRCHAQQIGTQQAIKQRQVSDHLRIQQLRHLGVRFSNEEALLHQKLGTWEFSNNKDFIYETQKWLHKLHYSNQITLKYPEISFTRMLGKRWYAVCLTATSLGLWIWKQFWQSPLSLSANLTLREKIAFGVKCGVQFKHKIR